MSENFEKLIAAFTRHLEVERSLSVHTIRAYIGDLESLLNHLETIGVTDISQLELVHLRSWLANQQVKGGARTTLSRRAVSVRLFTKWAMKNKYLAKDVAATLATPKGHRTLPEVLDIADAKTAMDSLATRASEEETPISLRDVAMVELLYATGARVAELCGLDVSDIDYDRQTIRVLGKGNKERTIPIGAPAVRALESWLKDGRSLMLTDKFFVSINNRTVILRKMLPKTETNKIEQSKFFDNQGLNEISRYANKKYISVPND